MLTKDLYFQFSGGPISYASLNVEKLKLQREKSSEFFPMMVLLSKPSNRKKLKIARFLGLD